MSVRLDGRSARNLPTASQALREFNKALPPLQETNHTAFIAFVLIILGGTTLIVATIKGWIVLYWLGMALMMVVGVSLLISIIRQG